MPDNCYVLADGRCISPRDCIHGAPIFEESALRRLPHLLGFDIKNNRAYVLCHACHHTFELPVAYEQIVRWLTCGGYIQKAKPQLNAGERELLISGTCNSCFDKLFLFSTKV